MEQAKGKLNVFITDSWTNPTEVVKRAKEGDEKAIGSFWYSAHDMKGAKDWVLVGTAEVTVSMLPEKEIISKQLDSLEEELRLHRVESQKKENHILDSISKLQSIGFSGKIDGVVVEDDDGIPF